MSDSDSEEERGAVRGERKPLLVTDGGTFSTGSASSPTNVSFSTKEERRARTVNFFKPSLRRKEPRHDFSTFDWTADGESSYLKRVGRAQGYTGWAGWMRWIWDATQGWIAVFIIGILAGLCAGFIDTTVHWVQDLKQGYCVGHPWLSKEICCKQNEYLPHQYQNQCESWKQWSEVFTANKDNPPMVLEFFVYVFLAIVFGGTSAWLVKTFAPYAAGSGIPEIKTILGGTHIKKYLGIWTLTIKAVALILSVGSGLSLGKEGPYVHTASCIGNIVSRFFEKYRSHESKKRELLSAAAAAGVSVAFGAPIGGVLFSLEEASYFFPHKVMWRSFFCAITAALVLKKLDPSGTGKLVMFQVDYKHQWHWFEIFPFVLLGIFGGIYGAIYIRANVWWCQRRKRYWSRWPIAEVMLVAGVTAIQFWNPYMRGSMTEGLSHFFMACEASTVHGELPEVCSHSALNYWSLLSAGIFKGLLAVFTFGLKVPSGLFIPSLYVGATFGRVVGMIMEAWQKAHPDARMFSECHSESVASSCIVPGVYAIVGAAATLSGVTRMTISLVVIMFELTGGLEYIVPIMVVVIISKWVGDWIGGKESIYEEHIVLNEYPFLDPKLEVNSTARVNQLIRGQQLQVLTEFGYTIEDVQTLLKRYDFSGFPVVNDANNSLIIGYIQRENLEIGVAKALQEGGVSVSQDSDIGFGGNNEEFGARVDLSAALDPAPIQVDGTSTLHKVLHLFKALGVRTVLVSRKGKLQGIITRKDLLEYLKNPPQMDRLSSGDEEDGTEMSVAPTTINTHGSRTSPSFSSFNTAMGAGVRSGSPAGSPTAKSP
eukprot:TRINITY_DN94054_c0_g1_i1.p1 TRINITY_DN94054_c0_g1~~TRINITY_DN94054_c0_g1_i1.p1  ORF type:complete len:830 (+),score=93.43 TRINITY_DN94054_c0_g1_i1:24-2492(+)